MGLFGNRDITGIDIGAGSIKVARIAGGGKRPRLIAAGMVEYALDPAKASAVSTDLKYLLSGKEMTGKHMITHVPGKYLTIRYLTLPKIPQKELREAVRWESKRHISYPLEAAQIEYVILGEKREGSSDKYEVLMVAVERGTVIEHLLPFREAGISVTAVDANPLAIRNVLRRRQNQEGNTAVVDMGAGKTEINIFKDTALRFSRCIDTGGMDMTRAVSERLDIPLPEAEDVKRRADIRAPAGTDLAADVVRSKIDAMLGEVRRSVEYYKTIFREKEVGRTILTGGVSVARGLQEQCSQTLGGVVELDTPFSGLTCTEAILEEYGPDAQRFASAVGLALRKA